MLFGIQQIGTAAILEDTHVIGPRGGYGTGVHTMLDHGTDIAAAYEFLEKGGKEFVADTEVSVSVYEIGQIDAAGYSFVIADAAEIHAVA